MGSGGGACTGSRLSLREYRRVGAYYATANPLVQISHNRYEKAVNTYRLDRRRRYRYASHTIDDPILTRQRRLSGKLRLAQLRAVALNLLIENLNQLRLCVRTRVRDLVVREDTDEVRDRERRGLEVRLEVVPFLNYLARRWARHILGERYARKARGRCLQSRVRVKCVENVATACFFFRVVYDVFPRPRLHVTRNASIKSTRSAT